jgi:hypothetical protein
LALLLPAPASAAAADTYEASWNGGYLNATANPDFTEATIDVVSVSFTECGTQANEASCIWEAIVSLHSNPATRCNPATPEDRVVWDSGERAGNGTVADGPTSFPLEGCRGQSLVLRIESHKTYEGTPPPWVVISSGSIQGLFTFGYHPVQEEEQRIINASPPANPEYPAFQPNFTPANFAIASDCRSLELGDVRYAFVFRHMDCDKAGNLARTRFRSGRAPRGYVCQSHSGAGVRCWRRRHPTKFFEWHLPRPGA